MNKNLKIAISITSNRPTPPRAGHALAGLLYNFGCTKIPFNVLGRTQASLLPQSRHELLREARAEGFSHQLWIDDDMEYPQDAFLRLLSSNLDVIGANYCRKMDNLQYTAVDFNGGQVESYGKKGIQEVYRVPMGFLLVHLPAIEHVKAPHFEVRYDEKNDIYGGEDRFFADRLREHGVKQFIDHDLSNQVTHWGDLGYNFQLFQPKGNDNG